MSSSVPKKQEYITKCNYCKAVVEYTSKMKTGCTPICQKCFDASKERGEIFDTVEDVLKNNPYKC